MKSYVTLRQLHSIACKVMEAKEQWGSDSKVLAVMVVAHGDKNYYAQYGDRLMYSRFNEGVPAYNVYVLTKWERDELPPREREEGDKVLVITGSSIKLNSYSFLDCYGMSIVKEPYVLDVIDLSVPQSTTQEA